MRGELGSRTEVELSWPSSCLLCAVGRGKAESTPDTLPMVRVNTGVCLPQSQEQWKHGEGEPFWSPCRLAGGCQSQEGPVAVPGWPCLQVAGREPGEAGAAVTGTPCHGHGQALAAALGNRDRRYFGELA